MMERDIQSVTMWLRPGDTVIIDGDLWHVDSIAGDVFYLESSVASEVRRVSRDNLSEEMDTADHVVLVSN